MKFEHCVPVIATMDVRASMDWYARVLGFSELFTYGEPPAYAGMQRDGVQLYISRDDRLATAIHEHDLHPEFFLWVQQVDAWFAEHRRSGARIVEEISDRAWDARQYVVEDPNGYFIKIAQPIDELAES